MGDKFCFPVNVREGSNEVFTVAVNDNYRAIYKVTDSNEMELFIKLEYQEYPLIKAELFTADFQPISDQMRVVKKRKVYFKFCLNTMERGDACSTDQNAADERNFIFVITALWYADHHYDEGEDTRQDVEGEDTRQDVEGEDTCMDGEGEDTFINDENVQSDLKNCSKGLALDMLEFLNNGDFSDATITNGIYVSKIHTTILSARSSVFRDFFEDPSNGKEINIPDATDEALKVMIDFIYSGLIELKSVDGAEELYELACKYKLEDLQRVCKENMSNFTTDRVLQSLILAKKHEDEELKMLAIEFILENLAELKSSGKWKGFSDNNADLMSEILFYTEGRKEKKVVGDFLAHTPSKKPRSSEDKEP